MRLVDRYLLREMTGPAIAALLGFVVLITGHVLFTVVDVIAGKGVRVESILEFAALNAPAAAVLAMPVATLLGCALALNRLASENEVTPLLAGGISGYRLMAAAVTLGVLATVCSLAIKEIAVPRADQRAQKLYREMLLRQKTLAFKPERFLDTGDRWIFIAHDVDRDNEILHGLRVFMRRPDQFPYLVRAKTARFSDRMLHAPQVRFYAFDFPASLDSGVADLVIDLGEIAGVVGGGQTMQNKSVRQLLAERAQRGEGDERARREYALEIHGRLSQIAACLVFSLLAAPIALRFGRAQSLAGVLATLVVAFVYFVVMLGLRILGGNGSLPVVVAAWSQNVVLVAVALIAMRRL